MNCPSFVRIDAALRHHALVAPDLDAWLTNETRVSYADADVLVDQIARAIIALGIKHGDRVCVFGKPRHEPIAIYLALGRIGAVYVGLNPKYTFDELSHIVGDCAPIAIIATPGIDGEQRDVINRVAIAHSCVQHMIDCNGETDAWVRFITRGEAIAADYVSMAETNVHPEDAALLVYTSGSTGKPKGAILPHRRLTFVAPIAQDKRNFGTLARPRSLCALPINHVGCIVDICSNTIWDGGAIIFQQDFDPEGALHLIEQERLTLFGGIPVMFMMMAEMPVFQTTDYSSVEKVVVAGNAAPVAIVELLRRTVGVPVLTGYGLTECMGFSSFTDADDCVETVATTIGKFDTRIDWRISGDGGDICDVGVVGEIQIRGDAVFLGYLNLPDETAQAFTADGWFRTGDLGECQLDGNIRLVGRKREMFKSGGYNVYPLEVEQALEQMRGVAMAVVVPVTDDRFSEVGHAFVVANDPCIDAAMLNVGARERLANYKIPKHFELVDTLPMLPVGKVDRLEVKRMAARQLDTRP